MKKKVILLADDDIDDTEMFCEALADIDESVICHCAGNGSEVFTILNEIEEIPELIFLDLNMPIMSGWECLKVLKKDPNYKDIPVIMISTSSHKNDMEMASNLGSICYFIKPNNFNDLKYVLQTITSNLGEGLKDALAELQSSSVKHIFTCNDV